MQDRNFVKGVLRMATAALMLSLVVAPSTFAKGGSGKEGHDDEHRTIPDCSRHNEDDDHSRDGSDKLECPKNQVLVRTDEKPCEETPGRPASIRKRVCCRTHGTTYCRPFRPCPPRSRS